MNNNDSITIEHSPEFERIAQVSEGKQNAFMQGFRMGVEITRAGILPIGPPSSGMLQ